MVDSQLRTPQPSFKANERLLSSLASIPFPCGGGGPKTPSRLVLWLVRIASVDGRSRRYSLLNVMKYCVTGRTTSSSTGRSPAASAASAMILK